MESMNKPEITQLTDEQIRDRIKTPDDMPTLYANHTRIVPSFFDIRIFLGQFTINPKGEHSIQEKLSVVLTPECAKTVVEALTLGLSQYESLFGPIRKPPTMPVTLPPSTPSVKTRKSKAH